MSAEMNSLHDRLLNRTPELVIRYQHIEEKYGVQIGDDWMAKADTAPFQIGQSFTFTQPGSKWNGQIGRVVDMRVTWRGEWEFSALYPFSNIPRWTNPKWMVK